ncbi:MAG: acetyltransferase [Candidatus Paceibacterota bacterium]
MSKYVIIGYSGHAYVVLDAAVESGIKVFGYAEKEMMKVDPYSLSYLGFEDDSDFNGWNKNYSFILGIGDNDIRSGITANLKKRNEILVTVIHPNTTISKKAVVGMGTFISSGVQVNALAKIGDAVILNTSSVIEHECIIDDYAHVAPGAVLAGNVKVGKCSFIGANSVIKEGIIIGDHVVIGAGSVVLKNVPNNTRVVGNPGRIL